MANDERWPRRPVPRGAPRRATSPRGGGATRRSARSSTAACAPRPTPTVHVWSETAAVARHLRRHPRRRAAGWSPRCADAGLRARRRRRVPAAELAGSGRRVLRARDGRLRARADRAHLRAQGGAVHPRPERRARLHLGRPLRPRRLPRHRRRRGARRAARARAARRGRIGRRRRRRPACGASRGTSSTRAAPADRDRRRGPRRRVRARVHVGHDERPEGRDAQPPHAARRGGAHPRVDHARIAEPHGLAGHPRDRHARRGARADGARRGHPPHRPVGSGPGARR